MFARAWRGHAPGARFQPRNRRATPAPYGVAGEGSPLRMQTAGRRRATWTIAVSVAAHVLVLAILATQRPTLRMPAESSGPPEPIIPILLMPRTPPPPQGRGVRPT